MQITDKTMRIARGKPTSAAQAKINQKNAEEKLAMLVWLNFAECDISLRMTYRPSRTPKRADTAQKDLYNFIRRVKRRYQKSGIELKYISCTEYGKSPEHYIILPSGLNFAELSEIWKNGRIYAEGIIFKNDRAAGLAKYAAKDPAYYRRWNQSKGLIRRTHN